MSTLGRRLTALEELAEEARTRGLRQMIEEGSRRRGLSPELTRQAVAEAIRYADGVARERDAMLRAGKSEDEILAHWAAKMGISVDVLRGRCEDIADRLF